MQGSLVELSPLPVRSNGLYRSRCIRIDLNIGQIASVKKLLGVEKKALTSGVRSVSMVV